MTAAQRARQLEQQLAEAMAQVTQDVASDVGAVAIPGVRRLSPTAFVVKSSMISESWSPEYWDAEAQKRRILDKIQDEKTLDGLARKLRSLLEDRQARIHPSFRAILQRAYDDVTAG